MDFFDIIIENSAFIMIGLTAFSLIILILSIILLVRTGRLKKKYNAFMTGANGNNLEELVLARFADIDNLKKDNNKINQDIVKINENLMNTYQKAGIVKYDAFKEMGGKLSFVLALLDKNNTGFLINSVHSSREGCYTYLKEIIKGESFLELSEDEKKALNQAINSNNFME